MTFNQKIALVNQLAQQEPQSTIRDYLEAVDEIEQIEQGATINMMGTRKGIGNLTDEQRREIILLAKDFSVAQICEKMNLSPDCIYKTCARQAGSVRAIVHPETAKPKVIPVVKKEPIPVLVPDRQKTPLKRPPSTYSNQGYLSTAQKYAL